MKEYFIGYDIGTSSIKVAIIDSNGKHIGDHKTPEEEMSISIPQPGWAEQDPDLWWRYVCEGTKAALSKYELDARQIMGVGISYQMHGLVAVDQSGQPVRNSIIWCDSRAIDEGNAVLKSMDKEACLSSILNLPGNFTASKLKWVKEHEADIYQRIHKVMLPGDYIAYKLCGTITTTIQGLSEGTLWDFSKGTLAMDLLKAMDLDQNMIPEIMDNMSKQGTVSASGAAATGLLEGTPILYRAGDQPNNALSLNVLNPGEVAATAGTSGVMYLVTDSLQEKEGTKINNFAHTNHTSEAPRIGKLLCINSCGILYKWLRQNLNFSNKSYSELNDMMASVQIGSAGVTVIPFGNGAERILENKEVGCHILNIDLNLHREQHLLRAGIEGIAFAFVYGARIMKAEGHNLSLIRAGNDNLFQSQVFSQTIATLLDVNIDIYNTNGATGAARAAGVAAKRIENMGEILENNEFVKRFQPDELYDQYHQAYEKWKENLDRLT